MGRLDQHAGATQQHGRRSRHRGAVTQRPVERVVVYLSGVGIVTGDQFFGDEQPFVDYLEAQLPNSVVVDNVFPYSVLNTGLTGRRALQRFWAWVADKRSWKRASVYDVPSIVRMDANNGKRDSRPFACLRGSFGGSVYTMAHAP